MIRFKLVLAAMVLGLLATGSAFAQGAGGGGGGGGGRGGRGGPGGMGGGMMNPFTQYVSALAEANLASGFTLTDDVKTKIQAVRDEFKKATDDFQTANKDDIAKAMQAMRDARQAQDQDAAQTAQQSMQAIMAKGPKADDYIAKIKALLTPDQVTAVDAKAKEMAAARPGGPGGGRGGPGGGGNPAPPPAGN